MKTTKREKSTSTKGHYVRNSDLLPAVIEAKALGRVTDLLIRKIQMIAERYSRKSNFIGYSFREDMVSAAVMNLCNNALKFNPEKSSNPFSFYTTAIHNSFLQYMADEKKHRNIKDALLVEAGSNPSYNYMQGEKDETHFEIKESDETVVPDMSIAIEIDPDAPKVELDENGVPVVIPEILPGDNIPRTKREDKVRYASRAPSPVIRYKPGDFEVDPATGKITIKPAVSMDAAAKVKRATKKKVETPVDPNKKLGPSARRTVKRKKEAAEPPLLKSQIPVAKSTRTRPDKHVKVSAKATAKKVAAKKAPAKKVAPAKKKAK